MRIASTRADLERALLARVTERVHAAGRTVDPDVLEHIVRQVLDRLGSESGIRQEPADGGGDTDEK